MRYSLNAIDWQDLFEEDCFWSHFMGIVHLYLETKYRNNLLLVDFVQPSHIILYGVVRRKKKSGGSTNEIEIYLMSKHLLCYVNMFEMVW